MTYFNNFNSPKMQEAKARKLLGVNALSSKGEITRAYRKLQLSLADRHRNGELSIDDYNSKMTEVNNAKDLLAPRPNQEIREENTHTDTSTDDIEEIVEQNRKDAKKESSKSQENSYSNNASKTQELLNMFSWRKVSLSELKSFISKGADVNGANNEGKSVLILAILEGNADCIKYLLDNGAKVYVRDNNGNSPLHHAANRKNIDILKAILKHNPDVNIADNNGHTPLMNAAYNGPLEAVKLLIKSGANVLAKTKSGHMASDYARLPEISNYLREEIKIAQNPQLSLVESMNQGQDITKKMLTTLISKKFDINQIKDRDGNNVLMYCSKKANLECVKTYFAEHLNAFYQARINETNKLGQTALMLAIQSKNAKVIEYLLSKDPNLNIQDNQGNTALHHAIEIHDTKIIEIILKANPDVNILNYNGNSPLMNAVCHNLVGIVSDLIRLGAKVEVTNRHGQTIKDLSRDSKISQLLTNPKTGNEQTKSSKNLQDLVDNNKSISPKTLNDLIKKGEDLSKIVDGSGSNIIAYFVKKKNVECLKIAIKHKVNIDHQDHQGNTALHHAIEIEDTKMIEIILKENPNVNIANHNGNSPLMNAVCHELFSTVKLLVKQGANVEASNRHGQTVKGVAREQKISDFLNREAQNVFEKHKKYQETTESNFKLIKALLQNNEDDKVKVLVKEQIHMILENNNFAEDAKSELSRFSSLEISEYYNPDAIEACLSGLNDQYYENLLICDK